MGKGWVVCTVVAWLILAAVAAALIQSIYTQQLAVEEIRANGTVLNGTCLIVAQEDCARWKRREVAQGAPHPPPNCKSEVQCVVALPDGTLQAYHGVISSHSFVDKVHVMDGTYPAYFGYDRVTAVMVRVEWERADVHVTEDWQAGVIIMVVITTFVIGALLALTAVLAYPVVKHCRRSSAYESMNDG